MLNPVPVRKFYIGTSVRDTLRNRSTPGKGGSLHVVPRNDLIGSLGAGCLVTTYLQLQPAQAARPRSAPSGAREPGFGRPIPERRRFRFRQEAPPRSIRPESTDRARPTHTRSAYAEC